MWVNLNSFEVFDKQSIHECRFDDAKYLDTKNIMIRVVFLQNVKIL